MTFPPALQRHLTRAADWLAVLLAMSLPWSTSATGIFATLWLIAALPLLKPADIWDELRTPAGGLPVLLWVFGVCGMFWADISWTERLEGLSAFHKLLFVPLFLVYFRQSENGRNVLFGFLAACVVLLAVSFLSLLFPGIVARGKAPGIPVKDYISQAAMFTVCVFALYCIAIDVWKKNQRILAATLVVLITAFLTNILFAATSRTALVAFPVLLVIFAFLRGWKVAVTLISILVALTAVAWTSSNYLPHRVNGLIQEIRAYSSDAPKTSAGERLEFWKKSAAIIASTPFLGHGTGSIASRFREAATQSSGVGAVVTANPHNQTLAVAIQLGLLAVILLWAMWVSHLWLFRSGGFAGWIGIVVIVQNMVSSLFNSHISDFTHGWVYVVGVGVAGGVALRRP